MAQGLGPVTLQNAVWFSAQLEQQFQASSIVFKNIEVMDIGNNLTWTGQYLTKLHSNLVGELERPVFATPQIVAYQASVAAYECPVFIGDTTIANVQFNDSIQGKVVDGIGLELGRRADQVVIAGLNANYNQDYTLSYDGYYNVQLLSQARNMLGNMSARGEVINLINFDQFNNLMMDQRYTNGFWNYIKPLADAYPQPNYDYEFRYQGMLFLKLPQDIALNTIPAHDTVPEKVRMFTFTRDCCKAFIGSVAPYGSRFGVLVQHQVHRGGWDINSRVRLGFVLEQKEGCIAVECNSGMMPIQAASAA